MTSAKKRNNKRKYEAVFILGWQMEDGNVNLTEETEFQFSITAHPPLKTCKIRA